MKKIVILFVLLLILGGGAFFLLSLKNDSSDSEQVVLEQTIDISKRYLSLRNRTDNILVEAEEYPDYSTWDKDMTTLIRDWNSLDQEVKQMGENADEQLEKVAVNYKLVKSAQAYTAKEISDIYDKAPRFKGIATLARHLGVDAKKAQLILNQAQDETTAQGWTEAGDTLQKLETSAVVIKDGCKVTGYVGGVVITGGAAGGFAAAGTLTQVTTVVVGVDLALEVTEDGAQIALGDKNKVSSFVKDIRTVTEPIASVLTITNIPNNLGTAYGKFESVMVGLEQFRESAQEGKVIGVDLRNFQYHKPFQVIRKTQYPGTVTVAEIEKAEVEEWLQSLNKKLEPMSQGEIEEFLSSSKSEVKEEKKVAEENPKIDKVDKDIPNQIIRIVNVSSDSYMMDSCFSSTCWDNLAANPAEDRDLGGIYTMGKVFGNGEGYKTGFRPADLKADNRLPDDRYKITLYFAIAPFEGPKNKTINYGTWISQSVEIIAKFGDEPVIEWDGNSLKQAK